jgi:conjugal transfer pilus assembly protein TraF
MSFSKVLLIAASGLMSSGYSQAAESTGAYYGKSEQGYWWYKDPKKLPPPVVPEEPKKDEKPVDEPFSVKWIQKNFDRIKEDAIENPDDKEKVRAYLYAVKVVMDKAQNFADSANDIAKLDPYLDASNYVPMSGIAGKQVFRLQAQAKQEILKVISEKAGFWFFFDTKCKFCGYQYDILQTFAGIHPNMRIRSITLDGKKFKGMGKVFPDEGRAKRLGLKLTPAIVLVAPPANFYVISHGMNTITEIENKTIMAARVAKLIPEELVSQYEYHTKGLIKDQDLKDAEGKDVDMTDSKSWVKFLQDKIEGRL